MVVNMDSQNPKLEATLLGVAVILFTFGMVGQYFMTAQPLLYRFVGFLLTAGLTVGIISRTSFGRRAWAFWQDSVVELRKVVWPTKQETIHSTVAVLAMVFVMGLVLWSIDAILVRLVAWIVRQGAA
ncbi:MAG TPA: preprotein translocase subunit SecE [Gammaproteobacteria bacterium]|nr:preprotein translocase subunit SecE [Gammaproteobacteria bacterium]